MTGCQSIKSPTFAESGGILLGLSKTNNELEIDETAGWKAMKTNHLTPFMGI
jgi:hypothetical protein